MPISRRHRRAALLALALVATILPAVPAAAEPAPVPPSVPVNVLTCGATGATADLPSGPPTTIATCGITAPTAGVVVILGAAGTAWVDGAYEAHAWAQLDGAEIELSGRSVDVGANGHDTRPLALLAVAPVGPGAHAISIAAGRSRLTGTARLTTPRLAALFIPDGSGIITCADVRTGVTRSTTARLAIARCSATIERPSHAILLGGGGGRAPGMAYEAVASILLDGAEVLGSPRTWDAFPNADDGTDVPFGTVAVTAVGVGDHEFALAYAVTSAAAVSTVEGPALVALVVPDVASRLRLCSATSTIPAIVTSIAPQGVACTLTATGAGRLLTTGGATLRPVSVSGSTADASVLDGNGAPDGVARTLELSGNGDDGDDATWHDAALRDIAGAGSAPAGIRVSTSTFRETAFGTASVLGLFVPAPDLEPPLTGFVDAPPFLAGSSSAHFGLTSASADGTSFRCALDDDTPWSRCDGAFTLGSLADGAHLLRAVAVDDVGNVDQTPAEWRWTVDATPPEIVVTTPADGSAVVVGTPLVADFRCDDAHPRLCDGTVPDGGAIDTAAVGPRLFTVAAKDALGHESATTVRFVVGHPLTVSAGDTTVAWGAPLPSIRATAQGLVDGESLDALGDGLRCIPLTALTLPAPGTYPTRCDGGASDHYAISYRDGTLTVTPPARAGAPRLAGGRLLVVPKGARSLRVGCALDRPGLTECTAELVARVGGRQTTLATVTGRATPAATGPRTLTLALPVDARLLRLARRAEGLAATIRLRATQIGYGEPLVRRPAVVLAPTAGLTLPTDPLFRGRTALLTRPGRGTLAALASVLAGARRLTCTGHTDARGAAAANRALGLARARAVCAALRTGRTRTSAASLGESRPRATNRTAAGRTLNRRVVVAVVR